MVGRRAAILALVIGAALAAPGAASAHALLQSADPVAGSTVATAPSAVTLTFGEAPDPRLSSVKVRDRTGQDETGGPVGAVPGRPDQLRVPLKPLSDGVYTVSWRTVSAVDGHIAAGSFAFGVGVPASSAGSTEPAGGVSSTSGSAAAALARWILYVGLVALFGVGFIGLAIDRPLRRGVIRLPVVGWFAALIGTLSVVAVQWSESGADLSTVLGSSIGQGAAERLLAVLAMTIAVAAIARSRPAVGRWRFAVLAGTAAGAMLVDVLTGHAAAGTLSPVQVGVQWLHVVAVGLWIGGLAALLLQIRGGPGEEKSLSVRRFSRWAGYALAVVAVTGIVRAIDEVGTVDALVGTDFGRLVILKSILLGVLALLGATNRFINVPQAARRLAGLRRIGSAEVALGTAVLLTTGLLVNLVPPTSTARMSGPPPPAPVLATGNDFGTTIRVRLAVEPGEPGFNRFSAAITDYDTGAPVAADRVVLRFAIASASGVGPSTLALSGAAGGSAGGTYAASGANLGLDGVWRVVAVVTTRDASVEVPLVLATRVPSQPVDVNAAPGAPTIYTVHLDGNRTVQVYLDPGRAGANDLHATFFDAAGTELPVQTAAMALTTPDGAGRVLNPRQLEPGHFVAEATAEASLIEVDVVGAAPDGAHLHANVEVAVPP
jgi:copper transport protein